MSVVDGVEVRELTAEELADADRLGYSMLLRWSESERAYLVSLPEWEGRVYNPVAHGATHAKAAATGREVLALLIASAREHGEPLPVPNVDGPRT